jgi:predicted membrane GTPase involved in stress response
MSLDEAIEYLGADDLLEITPERCASARRSCAMMCGSEPPRPKKG